jgi:hypothetical protein
MYGKMRLEMKNPISRKDFLKASGVYLAGFAVSTFPKFSFYSPASQISYVDPFSREPEHDQGILGRIATFYGIDVRAKPLDEAEIVGKRFRDQVVHIYEEMIPPGGPEFFNWTWYRVWGGFIHSAHVQKVHIHINEPVSTIPETGVLSEVTVPYSSAWQFNKLQGWIPWRGSKLYYESTHWLTGIIEGPDKTPWYQITSELSKSEIYFAPARHFRLVQPEEYSAINPDVPIQHKQIEVSIQEQKLVAYEYGEKIFSARISSGIPTNVPKGSLPTATPRGEFRIYAKQPSKHMGTVAGGLEVEAEYGFSLPGVPWTSFFKNPGGYALHGTYWHNNFGMQMSHGCINMRNEDAKFIFRWSSPVYDHAIDGIEDWEQTGYGTEILIT